MSSAHERSRNNVRAGIFVTLAVALAVGTVIVLTDVGETILRPTRSYSAGFQVADGLKNLKAGAQVRVGGITMGHVDEVRPRLDGGPFTEIEVDFSIDERVRLFRDAKIFISSQLIGSDAWLDIYDVGTPEKGGAEESVIVGESDPGTLATLLGPDLADDASGIVEDLKATTGDVRSLAGRISGEDWPRWAGSVDQVMTWATSATDEIDRVLAAGEGLLQDARDVIGENREPVRDTIADARDTSENLKSITATVRGETVDKVHKLLDRGQEGLDRAVSVLESVGEDYPAWSTDVGEALAGARLTAQQLKLASIEVRRSPWKLLYRPTRVELEHELLYEAARSFALAGSDLKASSASAERILADHRDRLDQPTVQQIAAFLQDSLDRYSRAQERLMDVLVTRP